MQRKMTLPIHWHPGQVPGASGRDYMYYTCVLGVWLRVDVERYYDDDRVPDMCTTEVTWKIERIPAPPKGLGKPHHYQGIEFKYDLGSILLGEKTLNRGLRWVILQGILFAQSPEITEINI